MDVQKYGIVVPVSEAIFRDRVDIDAMMKRWAESTPEQRSQWEREATEKRQAYREAHRIELHDSDSVLAGISRHFDWPLEYVRHLAQPYCECGPEQYDGGWDFCQHARDEGFAR